MSKPDLITNRCIDWYWLKINCKRAKSSLNPKITFDVPIIMAQLFVVFSI